MTMTIYGIDDVKAYMRKNGWKMWQSSNGGFTYYKKCYDRNGWISSRVFYQRGTLFYKQHISGKEYTADELMVFLISEELQDMSEAWE
jgi:hypothetical protein